jgi:ERCC4-type nuclease
MTLTVLIDRREQAPYTFTGLRSPDVAVAFARLPTGDYSLPGLDARVAIERKSLLDLHKTVARGRRRFTAELARLEVLDFALVVVEATWPEVCNCRPDGSLLPPGAVVRTVVGWQARFPRVRWLFADGRRQGEKETLRLLEDFAETQGRQSEVRLAKNEPPTQTNL